MMAKNAFSQTRFFDIFCDENEVLNLTDPIIIKAAEIYADLYQRRELIGDADILIAATALENNLTIATNNEAHFARINKLRMSNWLKTI